MKIKVSGFVGKGSEKKINWLRRKSIRSLFNQAIVESGLNDSNDLEMNFELSV